MFQVVRNRDQEVNRRKRKSKKKTNFKGRPVVIVDVVGVDHVVVVADAYNVVVVDVVVADDVVDFVVVVDANVAKI